MATDPIRPSHDTEPPPAPDWPAMTAGSGDSVPADLVSPAPAPTLNAAD